MREKIEFAIVQTGMAKNQCNLHHITALWVTGVQFIVRIENRMDMEILQSLFACVSENECEKFVVSITDYSDLQYGMA